MEPSLTQEQMIVQKDQACSIITRYFDSILDECEKEGIHAAIVVNCICELGMGALLEIAMNNNPEDETRAKRFLYQAINMLIRNIKDNHPKDKK